MAAAWLGVQVTSCEHISVPVSSVRRPFQQVLKYVRACACEYVRVGFYTRVRFGIACMCGRAYGVRACACVLARRGRAVAITWARTQRLLRHPTSKDSLLRQLQQTDDATTASKAITIKGGSDGMGWASRAGTGRDGMGCKCPRTAGPADLDWVGVLLASHVSARTRARCTPMGRVRVCTCVGWGLNVLPKHVRRDQSR